MGSRGLPQGTINVRAFTEKRCGNYTCTVKGPTSLAPIEKEAQFRNVVITLSSSHSYCVQVDVGALSRQRQKGFQDKNNNPPPL